MIARFILNLLGISLGAHSERVSRRLSVSLLNSPPQAPICPVAMKSSLALLSLADRGFARNALLHRRRMQCGSGCFDCCRRRYGAPALLEDFSAYLPPDG
jgi:hypothetical protein